jgi:hypothetical protein
VTAPLDSLLIDVEALLEDAVNVQGRTTLLSAITALDEVLEALVQAQDALRKAKAAT